MPVKSSGELSFELDIVDEFGGVVPHSLSEYYGADSGSASPSIPTSGELAFSDFYGTNNTIAGAKVLVVGGGSSGTAFGGGGAGGAAYHSNVTFAKGTTYTAVVGAGGGRISWSYVSLSTRLQGHRTGDNPQTTMVYDMDHQWGSAAQGNGGSNSRMYGGGYNMYGYGAAGGSPDRSTLNNCGNATGSASGGTSNYSNSRSGNAGAGLLNSTRSSSTIGGNTYQGGNGRTFTFSSGHSWTVGGGGTGSYYWNVSGTTPGGNVAGGSGGGGKSALLSGDRSGGVSPAAGTGNPPNDNSAYVKGGDAPANSGSGGGSGCSGEVIFADGRFGTYMGTGGSGVVIIGYPGSAAKLFGPGGSTLGSVSTASGYVSHRITSTTTFSM